MCVIAIAETKRPTPEQVAAMYEANNDGCGFAYRYQDEKDKTRVRWEKGLMTLEQAQKFCAELPLPFVAHFRIQTVGGKKAQLCHPFPILKDVPLDLKGSTDGFVLFHNGHWGTWRNSCLEAVWKTGFKLPSGKWSDSRAMAWSAAHFGTAILEFIDEKSVAFSPEKVDLTGKDWDEEDGVWYSNKNWKRCLKTKVGVDSNVHGSFRSDAGNVGLDRHVGGNGWRPTSASEAASRICKYGPCVKNREGSSEFCKGHQGEAKTKGGNLSGAVATENNHDDLAVRLLADSGFKGGGPVGDGPFEKLLTMRKEKEISGKQYKRTRKKMDKMIFKRERKLEKIAKKQKSLVQRATPQEHVSKLSLSKSSSPSLSVH